jgi:hypothetical protein
VWALEPVWMWWKKEKIPFLPPTRNWTLVIQPVT